MPTRESDGRALFGDLVVSNPKSKRTFRNAVPISLVAHLIAAGLIILVPVLLPVELPETGDAIRALLYDPPPPPPPPLPKGSAAAPKKTKPRTIPEAVPNKKLTVPEERPLEAQKPEQSGVESGSPLGTPEGMESGVEGGEIGGVPGGMLGGVIGGTGDIVLDYDQPPRLIFSAQPVYPKDAFIKQVAGVVEVEFIIGADGYVKHARIVRSIPMLDRAAIEAVMKWTFSPAVKRGCPVATVARAGVKFSIY